MKTPKGRLTKNKTFNAMEDAWLQGYVAAMADALREDSSSCNLMSKIAKEAGIHVDFLHESKVDPKDVETLSKLLGSSIMENKHSMNLMNLDTDVFKKNHSRINKKSAMKIREKHNEGMNNKELSAYFGTSPESIAKVLRGQKFNNENEEEFSETIQ